MTRRSFPTDPEAPMSLIYENRDLNRIFRPTTLAKISKRRGFETRTALDVKVDVYSNGTYTIAEVKDGAGLKGRGVSKRNPIDREKKNNGIYGHAVRRAVVDYLYQQGKEGLALEAGART